MREPDAAADERAPLRNVTEQQSGTGWSRRRALAAIGSVGTLGLAGCSLPSVTAGADPLWVREFTAASAAGPPAATDDHVVVGGQDRRLHGFTADGERVFTVETGGPIEARPAVPASGGPVHAHSTDGDLYTVGLSGEELWHVEGQAKNGWLGRRGSLLVGTDSVAETVVGYDARTGTRRFRRPGREYPFPILSDEACILHVDLPDGDGKLVTLAPTTGEVLWESTPRDSYPYIVAVGDRVVTVRDSTVRMRHARDGHVLWEASVAGKVTSHAGPPIWVGEHVYVRADRDDRPDELVAIDRDEGTVAWRRRVGAELETVTATTQAVFVASSVNDPDGGILIRLDAFALGGTRRWQTTTDIAIGGTVEALGRVGDVLFAASENKIAAYDPASGTRRWQYDPESYRIGVSAADSALYVSLRDSGGIARLPTS
ncbi:PQQ-like beta-propeller repeat protein [Haloarcula sp. S1CR25-12]|uniref:PQQ-like beta-propeller repeat protein n=1 Tax=Haloarcula saliterrae TaxID=2950534 RepID=A0ABU2FGX7_9EURY|nr:PQQ-binding-like beta-propeller repeat protein [Haloarcula sp. S1CR25-12]MDS0261046.1 PQQ-like beta-propeller repeat protein [Haloarcula sp. S1CR25-12]